MRRELRSGQEAYARAVKRSAKSTQAAPAHLVGSPSATKKRPPAKERVLIAAEAVFGERGYAQASVEDVLQAADVSRGTFYTYYANKEEVAAALLQRALDVLLGLVGTRFQAETRLNDKISAALDAYLELWQRHGRVVQDLWAEALRPGSRVAEVRRQAVKTTVRVIEASMAALGRPRLDSLVYEHLVLGIESVLMHRQIEGGLNDKERRRIHAAMLPLLIRVLGE